MKIKFIRFVSITVTIFMLLSTFALLSLCVGATAEESVLTQATTADNWGRSDLRAYLNGVSKNNNTLPYNTSHSVKQEEGYYESYFTDLEYSLVAPYKYNYALGDTQYSLTDKFWLPSAKYHNEDIISFGASDISVDRVDISRVIPMSYWSYYDLLAWTRNSVDRGDRVITYQRGVSTVSNPVDYRDLALSPAFKIDISNVTFAAMASAASLTDYNARKCYIMGSSDFGKQSYDALPNYGMYLKTASDSSFNVNNVMYEFGKLNISFDNASPDDYVVVQAYKSDNYVEGCVAFVAAQRIENSSGNIVINVNNWNITSFDGYILKIWAENADNGNSLAKATMPQTFACNSNNFIKTEDDETVNLRVFAMKDDLQCSWGTLASEYDLVGANATNQKIYFGTDSNGAPMEFWIAGRESYADGKSPINGDGDIDKNGNIMTLYCATSVEARKFNYSAEAYKEVPTPDMFVVDIPQNTVYSGTKVKPNVESTYFDNITVKYYSENNMLVESPVNAGKYLIKVDIPESELYEAVKNLYIGEFTIEQKSVTVTVGDVTVCINEAAEFSYTADGFIGSDVLLTEPTMTTDTDGKVAGEYIINASGAVASENYKIEYVAGKLTVTEHTYGDWTSLDVNEHQHTCSECGDIASEEHKWDDGKITKAPDCLNDGEKLFTCSECGATRIEAVESQGHGYDNACDKDCNNCGEARATEHTDADKNGVCDACSYEYPKGEPSETDTDAITDKAEETEKATSNVTDETKDETKDETNAEKKSGCGASALASTLSIIGIVGMALVIKKKED